MIQIQNISSQKKNVLLSTFCAKPFVKWVGGKGQLLPTLDTLLPDDLASMRKLTYIEPFVGGGAMLFYMLSKYSNIQRAVVNDINPNLIRAYQTVKNEPLDLIDALQSIQQKYLQIKDEAAKKMFYLYMREKFNKGNLSDIENTVLFIFLNRTCFNGLYRVNAKGQFNVPFGKYVNPLICDEKTIKADSQLLQKVEFLQGDFELTEDFVDSYTLVYFDPPYRPLSSTSSFNSYAKEGFNDVEQRRLKSYIDRLNSRCWMMLSNSDCAGKNPEDTFFDDLYKDYYIKRVYASRSVNADPSKRGKLTELLIRNYANSSDGQSVSSKLNYSLKYESTYARTKTPVLRFL